MADRRAEEGREKVGELEGKLREAKMDEAALKRRLAALEEVCVCVCVCV